MSIKETIRAEIERRKAIYKDYFLNEGEFGDKYEECCELLAFLDPLLEQDENAADKKAVKEIVKTVRKEVTRQVKEMVKEQPDGLEEEIAGMYQALFGTDIINRKEMVYLETFNAIARHFAEWGANHFRDVTQMVPTNLEEAARLYAIPHYMKDIDMEHIEEYPYNPGLEAAFKAGAEWGAAHARKEDK